MRSSADIINSYLWAAYVPPLSFPQWFFDCVESNSSKYDYTIAGASKLFDDVFEKALSRISLGNHIVPLSGGWDSRAILFTLIERIGPSKIITTTFGVKGQLDFDIGKSVARYLNVKNFANDLSLLPFKWENLTKSVQNSKWTYVPDGYFNNNTTEKVCDANDNIWSGFLGDLRGSHVKHAFTDYNKDVGYFATSQKRQTSVSLHKPGFDFKSLIPIPQNSPVGISDTLSFGIRLPYAIAPIMLPVQNLSKWDSCIGENIKGANVFAPFADKDWVGYWLGAPKEFRVGQRLYLEMLSAKFPKFFQIAGKSTLGVNPQSHTRMLFKRNYHALKRKAYSLSPWLGVRSNILKNYIDYDYMFRYRADYKKTIATAIDYLKRNEITPWLDLDNLWREHSRYQKNHGDAFCVLIGLAANLNVNPIS